MNDVNDAVLDTPRLRLRPFQASDYEAVHAYASVPDNVRFMLMAPNTEETTRDYLQFAIDSRQASPVKNYQFAAALRADGRVIGGCGIDTEASFPGNTAEIGWLLHRDYWKQGYGTELGRALLAFGFKTLGCHRIIARCDAENYGSYRVMEKIGMRREGCFWAGRRGNRVLGQAPRDELAYALLAEEWHAQQEMAYYNTLKPAFTGFINLPALEDGTVKLLCTAQKPGNPAIQYVPAYEFSVVKTHTQEKVGEVNLRIGYTNGLYYGGQIGYGIGAAYRGNGYAVRACRLLKPIMLAHRMPVALITNERDNLASRRVCEKLGARHLRLARLPAWHDLYKEGQRFVNIFAWEI